MIEKINTESINVDKDYIIKVRRYLHENPELSMEEVNTQKYIEDKLKEIGIEYKLADKSIIASIKGKGEGKIIALRADYDALPIEERSDVEFKSKVKGIMHACGHDAHTAMLLGAAKTLYSLKDSFDGEVRLFFQQGEEVFSGAKKIIENGGLKDVDAIFAMHGMPNLNVGEISVDSGYRLSGTDTIYIKFEGVSGHGASPHLAKDTVHPACLLVTDLQSIVTKNVNPQEPIVISVGKIQGGTKANIISKYTELEISMRSFDRETRILVHEAIKRHAKSIATMFEIDVDIKIEESTLSTFNDENLSNLAKESALKVFGAEGIKELGRQMNSEDFSYYLKDIPGLYAFVGYRNEEKGAIYPPHHEKFKIDEDYMMYGFKMHIQFALDFLKSN